MAEQPKATGGQPISLPKFQNVPVELDQTPSPKQASKRNLASDFMGRPEPLGGSEALRYLVEVGIKSYKPHKACKASQTSRLPLLYVAGRVGGSAGGLCNGRLE